jgi:hypothetical protein
MIDRDLIGGQVDCMITELATAYKLHTGGKARIPRGRNRA